MFLVSLVLVFLLWLWRAWVFHRPAGYRLPPGPRLRVPLLGQLFHLGRDPIRGIARLRKSYGDIFYLDGVGMFVCDLDTMEKMFKMEEFSGRVDLNLVAKKNVFKFFRGTYPAPGLLFSQGNIWKEQRRFAHKHLREFGFGRADIQDVILEEFQNLSSDLKSRWADGKKESEVNFLFSGVAFGVLWRVITGKPMDRGQQKQDWAFEKFQELAISIGVNDLKFFFVMKVLPRFLQSGDSFWVKAGGVTRRLFEIFEEEREEHERTYDETDMRDFMDVFIRECRRANDRGDTASSFYGELGRWNFVNVMFDLFGTGTETTSSSMAFVVLYGLHHPQVVDRLRADVDRVVGRKRKPSLEDRQQLPYVEAFLSEVQRHASLVPMAFQHAPLHRTEFQGFRFRKNVPITSCLYEVMHDPSNFADPDRFDPTRFVDPETGRYRAPRAYVPFGVGRRECLGKSVARQELFLFTASLLQQFSIEPASGGFPDLGDVEVGLIRTPRQKFSARFRPREEEKEC